MGARRSSGDRGRAGVDPVRSVIGRWIRENREFQHVTQAELCRSLRERGVQVSPSTLSRWERGEASPGADVLALLGVELGSSLGSLEERIHAAMVRSREEIDVTGHEPRELVEQADRAARAGNYHRALALLEAADDLVRLSGDEAPDEFRAGLLLRLAAAHMKLWHLEMARQALVRYGTLPGDARQQRFRGLVYRLNLARKERDWSGGDLLVRRLEALLSASEPREQAEAHQVLGGFWRARRKLDLAVEHFGAALAKRRETGPKAEETRALLFLGYCLAAAGKDRVGGERMVLEALSTSRRQGFRDIETWALYYLGRCRIESGNLEEGLAALEEAAERARDLRLDEARFAALYRAWLAVGGDDLLGRLRRLLAGIHPMVEEARQLRARLAGGGEYREVEP